MIQLDMSMPKNKYDDESDYYEWSGITYWAELPELPEDEDAEIS